MHHLFYWVATYWKRNHQTDEEFEQVLKEKHSSKIQGNRDKKQDMVNFFAAMKDPSANPEQERKMNEVLYGGKGDKKRHYAVDEKLYGTEEGLEKRLEAEKTIKLRKKRKKKKKAKAATNDDHTNIQDLSKQNNDRKFPVEAKNAAAVGAVGILAVAALLLNGKRSWIFYSSSL
jgi:hypothetical protein